MPRTSDFKAHCSIASDSAVEADLVKLLLEDDFEDIAIHVQTPGVRETLRTANPTVLLLAFKDLSNSQHYYLSMYRNGSVDTQHPHRTVLLCTKEDASSAYQLCRGGLFDEYVVFWPITHDPKRLLMAAHQMAADLREIAEVPLRESLPPPSAWANNVMDTGVPQLEPAPELGASVQKISHTVMVVDDNEFQRRIVGAILDDEGYEPVFAASGTEALNVVRSVLPSLILLDFQMPDIDGVEVIRQLKADSRLAAIPVIMVSGNGEKSFVLASRQLGAVDFIVKPFNRNTLVAKVARALNREDVVAVQ